MIDNMEAWQIWLAIGIGLFALETIVPGFVLGCLGVGALLTVIPSYFDISFNAQLVLFSIASILSFFLLRPFVLKWMDGDKRVKTNVDFLIGQLGIVSKDFDNTLKKGRVRAAGDDWLALNVGDESLKIGDPVIVTGVDSITLLVKKKQTTSKTQNIN